MKDSNRNVKIAISINEGLLERIENYADSNYMSRSGFITLACNNYLTQVELVNFVKSASAALNKISESGNIDQETLIGLQDLERTCRLLTGQK